MAQTYTTVHKVIVKRGTKESPEHKAIPPGKSGVKFTDQEAKELLAAGAIKPDAASAEKPAEGGSGKGDADKGAEGGASKNTGKAPEGGSNKNPGKPVDGTGLE